MTDAPSGPSGPELDRLRLGVRLLALRELRDIDAADEVAQETIARVFEAGRQNRLHDPQSLGAFARGVARHVIVDVIRARRWEAPLDGIARVHAEAHASDDALTSLVKAEQIDRVRDAIASLAPAERELIRLSYFEGVTCQELAARLHQPAARLRKRKERALERLRRAFFGSASHDSASRPTELQRASGDIPTPVRDLSR
jgi:RNA polymerase sigma-70 factor (ECF subfamily)